jgi:drug/metabolite transporter (DMT)-like permease
VSRRAVVLFALMSVIWGIPYLFIRVAVAEVSPGVLVFARTGIAALILLPFAIARTDLTTVLARWRWVVVFAAVEIGVPWYLLGSAEQEVTSSLAALLIASVPLIGTVVALVTGSRHRVGRTGVAGLFVGLVGVAAIVGVNLGTSDPRALVEIALVAVGYAVGPAILARRLGGLPSVGVMAVSLTLVAVAYAPVAAVGWPATMPSADALFSILVLGTVCTALAFVLFSALIAEIGPVRATVITYINPAVAAVLGVVVLSEPFTLPMAVGFGLVLAGSAMATRPPPGEPVALEAPSPKPEPAI